MRNILKHNFHMRFFSVFLVMLLVVTPHIAHTQEPEQSQGYFQVNNLQLNSFQSITEPTGQGTAGVIGGEWKPSDVAPATSTYPQQAKKPSAATNVTGEAGKCILQDLAAKIAKKGFAKFAQKTSSALTNAQFVPVYIPGLETKEVGTLGGYGPSEDGIAYCIVNSIIQYISDATIDWINSGFKGNPVFVDDPSRIFKDLAEETLDSFINSFGNGILCYDFSADIKLSLITKERPRRIYNCTYDRANANVKRLKEEGVFTFSAWDEVTQNPQNNRLGAFLTLDSNFLAIKQERGGNLEREIGWGSGYLPWKDKDNPNSTVSPGTIIQDTVERKLGLQDNRLVLADEFDEIVDALVDQLIKQAAIGILGEESSG